jgi:hypothetical protein
VGSAQLRVVWVAAARAVRPPPARPLPPCALPATPPARCLLPPLHSLTPAVTSSSSRPRPPPPSPLARSHRGHQGAALPARLPVGVAAPLPAAAHPDQARAGGRHPAAWPQRRPRGWAPGARSHAAAGDAAPTTRPCAALRPRPRPAVRSGCRAPPPLPPRQPRRPCHPSSQATPSARARTCSSASGTCTTRPTCGRSPTCSGPSATRRHSATPPSRAPGRVSSGGQWGRGRLSAALAAWRRGSQQLAALHCQGAHAMSQRAAAPG